MHGNENDAIEHYRPETILKYIVYSSSDSDTY